MEKVCKWKAAGGERKVRRFYYQSYLLPDNACVYLVLLGVARECVHTCKKTIMYISLFFLLFISSIFWWSSESEVGEQQVFFNMVQSKTKGRETTQEKKIFFLSPHTHSLNRAGSLDISILLRIWE